MVVATENPLLVRVARYEWGDSEAVIAVRRSVGWSGDTVHDQFPPRCRREAARPGCRV